jgi:hypothetical protein
VAAYQQASKSDEHLIYLNERPYSAQFYLQGKALQLTGIAALQASLTNSSHDFYALKADLASNLPEAVKLRLDPVNSYGTFALFHARSVDRR